MMNMRKYCESVYTELDYNNASTVQRTVRYARNKMKYAKYRDLPAKGGT